MTASAPGSDPTRLVARALTVSVEATGQRILDRADLTVEPGTVLGVVGESGSGKSTLVRCLLGAVAPGLVAGGSVSLASEDSSVSMLTASRRELRSIRGQRIAYLTQDPARSLTPTMRIGQAIAERLPAGARGSDDAVASLLRSVGLPDDAEFRGRYPFAVSGGQAQRVALARALASGPDVLLLDEPTTGLDVVTQAELLDELARQHRRTPRTTVLVSHDLAVVARMADHVVVLRDGRIVEHGPCHETLRAPQHPYTAELVAASPDPLAVPAAAGLGPVHSNGAGGGETTGLTVAGLTARHQRRRQAPVIAAESLDLAIAGGECVALVGVSGSGKSTIARAIVGAHVPDAGQVRVDGRTLPDALDRRTPQDRWRVQLIPQDPASSLDPRRTVGRAVGDVVRRCGTATGGAEVAAVVAALLSDVGLAPALADRRPGELSGGERQRVAIARALAASPSVLLCDEVTSALDVSVQVGVLRLLRSLVDDRGVAMLFITHDLGLLRDVADRVAVLHDGRVCESGAVEEVLASPTHAVTSELRAASLSLSAELARSVAHAGAEGAE
ncbi:MAG: ABC transporter ATP-binding protein [Actinomycetota bacterium]